MKRLIVSLSVFEQILNGLIASGVTFEARQIDGVEPKIEIIFTGGF